MDPDGRKVKPEGTPAEKQAIQQAIRKIVQSSPVSAARYKAMVDSNNVHKIRFPKPGEAQENKTTGIKPNESVPGVGTGSESIVNSLVPIIVKNSDGTPVTLSGEALLAHELLGHVATKTKALWIAV